MAERGLIGVDKVLANNRELLKKFKRETEEILNKAALETQDVAKGLVPVDTGRLRVSIKVTRPSRLTRDVSTDVDYAGDVEFGTSAHDITPKSGKFLVFRGGPIAQEWSPDSGGGRMLYRSGKTGRAVKSKKRGEMIFAKKVRHPGTSARPYMRPAYDRVGRQLRQAYEQLARRVSGKK
jgi:HK97 gp10 family phage protein